MNRLRRCTIEDFGLIAAAQLEFADGLTVFTGETGSGKTMVLGALRFVLGERASADAVRTGAARAVVTLELEPDEALREAFAADGFEVDEGEDAILMRELSAAGKSVARVNGRAATSAQLRALGESLIDFVGQHEHQRLLSGSYQLDVLDRFAGDDAVALRRRVGEGCARLTQIDRDLKALEETAGRELAEAEFARFAVGEIDAANLTQDDEEERLRERKAYLANVERIAAAVRVAHEALGEEEGSGAHALGTAAAALGNVARFSESLARFAESVAAMQSDANELAAALARELDRTEFDPAESEEVGARLDAIERLKRKYGGSIAAILESRDRFAASLGAFDSRDERAATLRAQKAETSAVLEADAKRLTELRTRAARSLERGINAELPALAMRGARFAIEFEQHAAVGARGAEAVQFAFSANRGEPLRPISKVASGGELSRLLLALVVALADKREPTTLVFDEIDAGIGGAAASAVGVRLGALARTGQVVCVTHLAQIAAWADAHVALRKIEKGNATRIDAVALDGKPTVVEELARMLSGRTTGVALEHAEQLLRDTRAPRKRPNLRSA